MKKRVTLEETKRACLDLLTDFDAICKKYNLKYSIYYGTLLGAVRHKGFIPWDDDVDVVMPRPDYERLVELIQSGAFKEDKNHDFFMDRGKGAYYNFLKFMDTRYPIHCPNHIEAPYLFLDVFPLDGVPDDEEEFKKIYRKERKWVIIAGMCQWYTMDRWWGFIAYVIGWWAYLGAMCIGAKRCVKKFHEAAAKYPYEKYDRCALHFFGAPREAVRKSIFDEFCELEFEGRKFTAVKDWNEALTALYGDYMQLPPKKQQRSRHYMKVYKIQ